MKSGRHLCLKLWIPVVLVLLSGCQLPTTLNSNSPIYSAIPDNPSEAASELKRRDTFLAALDKVDYQLLDTEKTAYITIDSNAQVIPFKTGKSYVRGIVLPDDLASTTIKIEAIADKTVFVPTILILKQNFRPSRVIDSSDFTYQPAGILTPDRLQGTFAIDHNRGSETVAEKYLLIFTTEQDSKGVTKLQSQADQYAKARGLADPRLPKPVARHAATGLLKITAIDPKTMAAPATTWEDLSGQQPGEAFVDHSPVVPGTAAEQAEPSADESAGMFPETEAMYNRLIRKNVDDGNIDKAWRLVQEGEKAGSVTVRRTFMRALDQKK